MRPSDINKPAVRAFFKWNRKHWDQYRYQEACDDAMFQYTGYSTVEPPGRYSCIGGKDEAAEQVLDTIAEVYGISHQDLDDMVIASYNEEERRFMGAIHNKPHRPVWGSQEWAETHGDDLGESPDY